MTYEVTYETRQPGAIGIFTARTVQVEADDERAAIEIAGDQLRAEYETRSPIKVRPA